MKNNLLYSLHYYKKFSNNCINHQNRKALKNIKILKSITGPQGEEANFRSSTSDGWPEGIFSKKKSLMSQWLYASLYQKPVTERFHSDAISRSSKRRTQTCGNKKAFCAIFEWSRAGVSFKHCKTVPTGYLDQGENLCCSRTYRSSSCILWRKM